MFTKPSLLTRIATGKMIGLVLTLGALLIAPAMFAPFTWAEQLGFVLWYTSLGAFVGLFGVMNWHPMLGLTLPWWFRGPWLGGWMNLVLMLFIWDTLAAYQAQIFGAGSILSSPWWLVAEGIAMGALMDWACTRLGGEGPATVSGPRAPV